MSIKGILFDFIGTTVMEKDPRMISRCFISAFNDHGIIVTEEFIRANRGRDKTEVISTALHQSGYPASLIEPVKESLKNHIANNPGNFYENDGAREIFSYLKERNILLGLGTGLPADTFEQILCHLKWDKTGFDYIGVAEQIGKGRPHPDMIFDMLQKCHLRNDELLKVGDTVADIREGKNAGTMTAAILSGTQDEKDLAEQNPDFIFRSLGEIIKLIR